MVLKSIRKAVAEVKSFKVIIGCDNAAVELKEVVKEFLDKNRVPYEDMGCDSQEDPTVYPEIARRVCEKIMDSGYPVSYTHLKEEGLHIRYLQKFHKEFFGLRHVSLWHIRQKQACRLHR